MIEAIIFDFGDVFINLDKAGAMKKALDSFGLKTLDSEMFAINIQYEKGLISTEAFIEYYSNRFSGLSSRDVIEIWNFIIKDFPEYRLDFLRRLAIQKKYKLILLSNTNELHMKYIKAQVSFYKTFESQFDAFYLSHEIQKRKPDTEIFNFVLNENKLMPQHCLFIDDTSEHIETAHLLGFKTWNIDPTNEDVVHLFDKRKELF